MKNSLNLLLFLSICVVSSTGWGNFSIKARYGTLPSAGGTALTAVQIAQHTNLARCLCDQWSEENDPYSYYFEMQYTGTFDSSDVYFYLGNDCANTAVALTECAEIGALNINSFQDRTNYIPIPVNHLVDPAGGVCRSQASSSTYYIFSNLENRTVAFSQGVAYDTKAPAAPIGVRAVGGEGSLSVSWDAGAVTEDRVSYFNVLCAQAGAPAPVSSEDTADWVDTEDVCGKVLSLAATEEGESCPDGALTAGGRAHPCYVCASVASTASSVRITGLENGVAYQVAVVAVDDYRNASPLSEVVDATPVPTTDFAEHYRELGGAADGDYCFLATTVYGDRDHPFVRVLRSFRDVALLTNPPGRAFVRWYYRNGPAWAAWVEGNPLALVTLRILMLPLVLFAFLTLTLPLWLPFAWWAIRQRRRLRREVSHA